MLCSRLKACLIGILFGTLAHAAGERAPRELLLRLQQLVERNPEGSRSQLEAAIRQYSSEPGLYNLLGIVDAQRGNGAAAEADFRKALQVAPDFTGALLNLGRLYLERSAQDPKATGQALEVYQKILRYEASNTEALFQSALLLNRTGSYQASLHHLGLLPQAIQEQPLALAVRCADQSGLNQPSLAAGIAERLLRSPALTEADVMAVLPQIENRDAGLAVRMIEGLAERRLATRQGLWRLGWHYRQQEKLPEARALLEQAEQDGPPSAEILQELARVAYQQHDREGALGYLAHARDLEPGNAAIHFFFGVVCIELNLPLEAGKSLAEAVRLDPQNAYYNYARGSVALQSDPAQAIPYFEKYMQRKPEDPRGQFALGVAQFYLADYETAARNLGAIADRKETAAGAHYFLGRMAKLNDHLPEAEIELKQAVAANPRFADALAELGQLHLKLGRYDDARQELERAFALEPDNFRVNMNLLVLYMKTKDPRAAEQQVRFEEIKKKQADDEPLLWRTIEVRPY